MMRKGKELLDLLYPARCPVCDGILLPEEELDTIITRLAHELDRDYAGTDKRLVLVLESPDPAAQGQPLGLRLKNSLRQGETYIFYGLKIFLIVSFKI